MLSWLRYSMVHQLACRGTQDCVIMQLHNGQRSPTALWGPSKESNQELQYRILL